MLQRGELFCSRANLFAPRQTFLRLRANIFAKKFRLLDIPNKRKIHKKAVPNIGGLSISLIFILATYFINFQNNYFNIILSFSLLISLAGFIDDRYNLNVGTKLIWQLLPICLLIFKFDLIVLDVISDHSLIREL